MPSIVVGPTGGGAGNGGRYQLCVKRITQKLEKRNARRAEHASVRSTIVCIFGLLLRVIHHIYLMYGLSGMRWATEICTFRRTRGPRTRPNATTRTLHMLA